MTDAVRARRVAVRIREIVAATVERQIKDPRLGMVTITEARLTADLREATVFYTVLGDEVARTESAAALDSATGVLRTTVGRQIGLRHTPSLSFVHDALPDSTRHLDELLAEARIADAAVAARAHGAQPAGEADPYRSTADPDAP
ncbi:MAG TPA: 30S ribosome-binding factor RbfA [Mycobacteriales bacterium]|nr:30S ribosome-binding factor RbfA [Mycobacteriales bacterium]